MQSDILYIITIVACIIFVVFGPKIQLWWAKRDKSLANGATTPPPHAPMTTVTDKDGKKQKVVDYKQLFRSSLAQLNCTANDDDANDDRLLFSYQGMNFFADTQAGIPYVEIFLTWWGNVDLGDIDDVAALQKAINTANCGCNVLPKVIYTYDTDDNKMAIHTRATVPFMAEIPNLPGYLSAIFDQFFAINRLATDEFNRNRTKTQSPQEQTENS